MHLKEGTLLQNGKYRIERKLGQGSYGITYLATMKSRVGGSLGNMEVSVSVAVKEFFVHDNDGREGSMVTYSKGSSLHEKYKKKFRTESEKLSRLSHPNIVKVLDSFESNNTYYYVMEYCGGGSLDSVIPKNKGLEEMDAIRYAIQIGEALRYMHGEKMLHLDLKPGNVVLREDGTAVLIDFGLSKEYDDVGNPETSTTIGQGTKGYAPIEQAYYNKENKTFPVTIDVYALGATMYKMLTGKTPPDASDILNKGFPKAELKRNGISDYIVDLVEKSMSPIVSDRLQSVDEFLDLLVKAEESEATLKECSGDRDLKEKTLSDEEERKRREEEDIKRRVEEELKRREEEKRHEQELERERRKEEEIKRREEEERKRREEEERKRREEEERKRREEEERKRREEEERKRREEEERKRREEEERKRREEEERKRREEEERKRKNRMKWIIAGVFVLCFFIVPAVYRNVHENKAAKEYDRLIREGDEQLSLNNFSESIAKYNEAKELEDKYKKKRKNPSNFNNNAKDKLDSAKKKEDEYNKQELAQKMLKLVNGAKWRRDDFEKAGYEDLYDALNKYEFAKVIEYSKDIPAEEGSSWESIIKFCKKHTKENIKGPYSNDGSITIEIYVDKFLKETAKASQLKDRTFEVKGVKFKMIAIEGGTFNMGATSEQGSDAYSNEKPVHSVTLSDYYIGETEVTQELWEAVMGSNPSAYKGSQKPVERVSWNDCKEFIEKLNQLTGKNFRLPTEAEWEYAARGGNESQGYKYIGSNTIGNVAWYTDNSSSKTHDVKTKSPNELGIYDMSGNVWEWCEDCYGYYSSGSQTNPTGPSSGSHRVLRGGCWNSNARGCRVSNRNISDPDSRGNSCGFRLALSQ